MTQGCRTMTTHHNPSPLNGFAHNWQQTLGLCLDSGYAKITLTAPLEKYDSKSCHTPTTIMKTKATTPLPSGLTCTSHNRKLHKHANSSHPSLHPSPFPSSHHTLPCIQHPSHSSHHTPSSINTPLTTSIPASTPLSSTSPLILPASTTSFPPTSPSIHAHPLVNSLSQPPAPATRTTGRPSSSHSTQCYLSFIPPLNAPSFCQTRTPPP
ncbi:proline-rich receptor-like protein kinase PERK2 [Portunus trituberculatus]|uniref:proline-rich receptor-like protein kinase PERK2 n=1 Tax=Portunus trituberculatus TaxID=210409 RepID=UPI001E1CBD12|nr:proline-rich receptor-like protein kinase PERK2 [Portunus trituberculatus]